MTEQNTAHGDPMPDRPETCPYCTGSHWLADNETLGPCLCCTPEALQVLEGQLDDAYVALGRRLQVAGDNDLVVAIDFARTTINEAWGMVNAALELRTNADHGPDVTLADKLDEALDKAADDARAGLPDAQAALSDYLVSIGLPAHPTAMTDGPLCRLWEALNP